MNKHFNKRILLLIVPFVLLAACRKEMDGGSASDIWAEVEVTSNTRTSLSVDESGVGTIFWNSADKIDVFFGTKKAGYTSQNTSDATSAVFKTSDTVSDSDASSTNIWGLYPSNSSSTCDGSSVTTTLPSTQYGVPNTFDDDLFLAIAHSTSTSLQFYNVCGGIKFNLAYDDIKKITFRGNNNENLAGTVSISFMNGVPKATIVNGVKEITLAPKSGSTFTKGADYYITLLPCTLSSGFAMTFIATDGTTGTLSYTDQSVTIKRSVFARKGNMDVYASFPDERQPNNVIYYTSSNGQVITPYATDVFGANIVSNEYVCGRGIITFDGDVTIVGHSAFYNRSGLTAIKIPNSVTEIGNWSFGYCSGLTTIEIPSSVERIGDYSLSYCSGLTTIIVEPDNPAYDSRNSCNAIIETSTNTLISGCKRTIIPDSVVSIGKAAFWGCYDLTSIEIPNSVISIGTSAFQYCDGLASLKIPDSVVSVGNDCFLGCYALTSIEMSNSITSIGSGTFYGCSNLLSVQIPCSVMRIGESAFGICSSLTSIEIPNSVTYIGQNAFASCTALESITIYATSPPSIGSNAFTSTNNCPIYVPASSVDAYKSAWSAYSDRILAIQSSPATSLIVTALSSVVQLNSQHEDISISLLELIEIKDDRGYHVLHNGEWVIGNGLNGFPDGVSARDYYEVSLNFAYDTSGLPLSVRSIISVQYDIDDNGDFCPVFRFYYSSTTDTIDDTYTIPVEFTFSTNLGTYKCYSQITIKGEGQL